MLEGPEVEESKQEDSVVAGALLAKKEDRNKEGARLGRIL